MKLYRFIILFAALCGVTRLCAEEAVIALDSKWELPSGARITDSGGAPVLHVAVEPGREKGRKVTARREFDIAPWRGRLIELIYEVRAVDVSKPPEVYNGIKLMLHYRSGEKEHWPNTPRQFNSGSYDWMAVPVLAYVSPDAEDGYLQLGLQNSSGVVEVRSVKVRDLGAASDPFAAPVPVPENFRAEYTARVTGLPRLRGAMSPNSYKPEDLEEFARWGGNLIRWQLKSKWNTVGADRDIPVFRAWLSGKLDELEQVLAHCEKLGIKVAIDMHGAPGARHANLDLAMFHEKEYADAFVDCWREIATRFKGHKAVWGYDLINEPSQQGAVREYSYLAIQYRAAKAIREIDPETPIIVTSSEYSRPRSFRYLHPLPLPNIIYEVHMYRPSAYTHQGLFSSGDPIPYPGMVKGEDWNIETIRKHLAPVREFEKKYGARIYVGEFSAVRYAPGAAKYLEDVIAVFEEYGWDWSYHAFRESHYWSVEYAGPDGAHPVPAADTDRKRVLLRAYEKNQKIR